MAASVSADSALSFLEQLTGEVPVDFEWGTRLIHTRYSPTNGADQAAQFIARVLQTYGYDVTFDFYRFDQSFRGLSMKPGGSGLVVATGGMILRTSVGDAWVRMRDGCDQLEEPLRDLCQWTADKAVAVGDAGTIMLSTDGGVHWTSSGSGITSNLNAVDLSSTGIGWAVGDGGMIKKTVSGGLGWITQQSGVIMNLRDVAVIDGGTAVIVGDNGLILRSGDGGQHWNVVPSGLSSAIFGLTFAGSFGWAVGQSGKVLTSTDGGFSWSPQSVPTTNTLNAVSFADPAHGWIVGNSGRVLHTSDGGANWTQQNNPMAGANFFTISAVSAQDGWLGGDWGHLLRTTNEGATWTLQDTTVLAGWANVVATKPGTVHPEQEVLLTGHYDSMSESPTISAPGADDNGSGTATVVEAARNMSAYRFEKTIRFVCLSGEEEGLLGSAAYAGDAVAAGNQIVGVFNLDCVGWSDQYLRIVANGSSDWLGTLAQSMALTYAPELPVQYLICPSCNWSDHGSFWERGFDAICGIESWEPMPPQIHTSGDRVALLNLPLIARVCKISLATVATIAVPDTASTGVPGADWSQHEAGGRPTPLGLDQAALSAAFPNPTSSGATIRFVVPARQSFRLMLYDPSGRQVRSLGEGMGSGGVKAIFWDGTGRLLRPSPAGVYLYKLEAGGKVLTSRVVLVR